MGDFTRDVLHIQVEVIVATLVIVVLLILLRSHRFGDFGHEGRRIDLLLNACIRFEFPSWADFLLLVTVASLDRQDLRLGLRCGYLLLYGEVLVVGELLERVWNAAAFLHVVVNAAHLVVM